MRNLANRVAVLEGPKEKAWYPCPEGVVLYDGPRDGAAIVTALGLDDMDEVTLEVCSEVNGVKAVIGGAPQLVTELTEGGRQGMCPEFRKWAMDNGRFWVFGQAWTIHWAKAHASKGFIMEGGSIRKIVATGESK